MRFKVSLLIEREDGRHVEPVTLWDFREMTQEQVDAVVEAEQDNWARIGPGDFVREDE